jgi:hypothetical protein
MAEKVIDKQDHNAEIINHVTVAFLEFRRALSAITTPDMGTIDDLTLTWMARYPALDTEPSKKIGKLHVIMHTKTAPDAQNGRQTFNSIAVDSNMSFEHDRHPAVVEQDEKVADVVAAAASAVQ